MYRIAIALVVVAVIHAGPARAGQEPARAVGGEPVVDIRHGDRIVFIGDSFFEREYRFGLIETALTVGHPDKDLTFRNLGWSGDTAWGEARAYFGKPQEGYAELLKFVELVQPNVIIVGYGANESFAGEEGLESFLGQYQTLLGDLEAHTPRIAVVTPLPADAATSPLPQQAVDERNQVLSHYSEAIRALARTRGLPVVDLFTAMLGAIGRVQPMPLFENGIHLTEAGYLVAAEQIARRTARPAAGDGFPAAWRAADAQGPTSQEPLPSIRKLVVEKNELFFHRWRPANVTYLFLFRQREQGKNAVEIPRFDPLVEQKEREIAGLRAQLRSRPGNAGQQDRER